MSDEETQQKQTRTQRRVLRTRATIEQAFVELILEKGYDNVNVEDITNRADVARATFYAHYPNKEALLAAVFSRLIGGLHESFASDESDWFHARHNAVGIMCLHAQQMQDLYKACLSDPWARGAYITAISEYTERKLDSYVAKAGSESRVPIPVMARAFAGAHLALLDGWLAGDLDLDAEDLSRIEIDLTTFGWAWGMGLGPGDFSYSMSAPGRESSEP